MHVQQNQKYTMILMYASEYIAEGNLQFVIQMYNCTEQHWLFLPLAKTGGNSYWPVANPGRLGPVTL